MKKAKLLLLTLLVVMGYSTAMADNVSPYEADFNSTITTTVHDFAVASNWKHIVGKYTDDWDEDYYMSYSYKSDEGIEGSGTLLAYRQYAQDPTSYNSGATVYDLLVTPVVSGEVKLYVKKSISASTSIPSFVEFYKVNATGTTRGDLIQRFTDNDYVADESIEGWSYVTITLDEAQRVGIRAQHVYLDNFSAANADIVLEKSLSITGLSSVAGGNYIVSQNADGTTDIELKVTLKNTGDVDFKAGDDNYTLTLVKKAPYSSTETVFDDAVFSIDQDIEKGKEATFVASFKAPAELGTGWMYLKVKENISGTTSSAQVWTQVKEYASGFIFDVAGTSYYSSSSATTTPIDFGKVTEATTLNYEIYNPGSAPLTINSFTIDSPFTTDAPAGEFTVAAGEKKQVAITFPATEPGIFEGKITIEYTNFGKEKATYTLDVKATVIDPSKNMITFDNGKTGEEANGKFPEGSIHTNQVWISKETVDDGVNFYLQGSSNTKFITPLLTAEAGEQFAFDTWANSYGENNTVTAYISKDRENWTQVAKESGIGSKLKTIITTIEEAGDYWLAFELSGNAYLDNIYGLTFAEQPEHNWYIISNDVPTKGKQNTDYTATIKLKNINSTADWVEGTIFLDGEAVDYSGYIELPGNEKTAIECIGSNHYSNIDEPTVLTITFKPHKAGVLPLYIKLSGEDGKIVYTTETVDVTIAEEKTESLLTIGEVVSNKTSTNVPFNTTWMDEESGLAECDFRYTAEMLSAFGLRKGDVISAITFTGTPAFSKEINSLTAEAWVGIEEAGTSFTAGGADKSNMFHAIIFNEETVNFTENEEFDFVINLDEPITWDGTSSIRIATNINGHGKGQYVNIKFPIDSNYSGAYFSRSGGAWSSSSMPVAYLSLDVEEITFAGVVTDIASNPIEGAKVVAWNMDNDVEYTAVTDADGKFSMNIVQNKLKYLIWVEKTGYQELLQETRTFEDGSYTDAEYVLTKDPEYIDYTFNSTYGWGTFYSSTTNYAIPEGVNAFIVSGVEDGIANLTEIDFGFIPEETAVIITGEPGETYGLEPYSVYEMPQIGENLLCGTDEDEEVTPEEGEKLYMLSFKNDIVGFYYGGDEGGAFTNKAHRAYLRLKVEATGEQPSFIRIAGGSATGISNAITTTTDAPAYNLAGQRVDKSYKGVVIVNGKKILRK
ncbi:MAG: carboxypeptidase regulatory-like domain-containing protein [Prevotella sp.]|nr:carboxypeptidase regulatory-like domain-containing protein [Prevotella sp.]